MIRGNEIEMCNAGFFPLKDNWKLNLDLNNLKLCTQKDC